MFNSIVHINKSVSISYTLLLHIIKMVAVLPAAGSHSLLPIPAAGSTQWLVIHWVALRPRYARVKHQPTILNYHEKCVILSLHC